VPLPGTVRDPLYPDSDGKPMGESDAHTFAVMCLREALEDFFAQVLEVYIASQIVYYYELGNPNARRDPDILVARGVAGKHGRRSFRLWEEGVTPCTFFEISSESTWREDIGPKRELYERLGIREYFLFDPEGEWLDPVFQGFRLRRRRYAPIAPDAEGFLVSTELGLKMRPEGAMLRLADRRSGVPVLTRTERNEAAEQRTGAAEQRAEAESQRAEAERQGREAAEQRAARLEAELNRLRERTGGPNGGANP
jgi:Uma2 family endonuclease